MAADGGGGDAPKMDVELTMDENEALFTPISRRTDAHVDVLIEMIRKTGFPVADAHVQSARKMCGILTLEGLDEGNVLFEEGSESSDIYIVLEGCVDVRKKAVPMPINVVKRGGFFGEMALLHSDPVRHSSIVCSSKECKLVRMDAAGIVHHKVDLALFQFAEQHYKDMQDRHDEAAAESSGAFASLPDKVRKVMITAKKDPSDRTIHELDHMLDTMKTFALFDEKKGKKFLQNSGQRRAVAAVLHCRTYEPGRCVCAEGEDGQSMFIVLIGRLAVSHIDNTTGESQHLKDLTDGQDFGELALLGDSIRTATVVANDFTVLLELRRPDYDATFRQADEEEIIEKVQNLTVCPLFTGISLKKMLRIAYGSTITTFSKDQIILTEGLQSSQIMGFLNSS